MNESDSVARPDDDPLGPVVESFLERFRRGERPALTALVERHPELAEQIRELIPALVELEQLGGGTGSAVPSSRYLTDARQSGDEHASPARLGDYLLIRRIGGGGMGVVYEAEHRSRFRKNRGGGSRSCTRDSGLTRNTCGGLHRRGPACGRAAPYQ